jgi:membrane-bound lytic murein transglycosylase A
VAQDTGSAITGPARADIYFGPGAEAGRQAGRLRHHVHFVILVPKSLDPAARGRKMPLPDARPSEKIAKLFPQVDPAKEAAKGQEDGTKSAVAPAAPPPAAAAQTPIAQTVAAKPVPLPEARPNITSSHEGRRHGHRRRYRRRQ